MEGNWLDGLAARPLGAPIARPAKATSGVPETQSGPSFADVLQQAQARTGVHFSAHALNRLQQRGMSLSADDVKALSQALDQANGKGSRDAYLVYGNAGFVVNVPKRTVITTMMNGDNTVVTNIDSVVFVPRPDR